MFFRLSPTALSRNSTAPISILSTARRTYTQDSRLGEALTKEFILKHVFETVPELIRKDSDLLRILLQRHYRKQQVPEALDNYFLSMLDKTGRFKDWPLKTIVPDRSAFWDFLQERWPLFVNREIAGAGLHISEETCLKFSGAMELPFDHDDVRVYVDNLFAEGILKPIEWVPAAAKSKPWIRVGLKGGPTEKKEILFEDLCNGVEENAPASDANVHAWLAFGGSYGQIQRVWNQNAQALKQVHGERYASLRQTFNGRFAEWISTAYRGIYNYPAVNPVMVHHIPAFLANRLAQGEATKVALLLLDGLAMDQWLQLKDSLAPALNDASVRENALMAWIPTITPVSRQAAFSGKIPVYFTDTIYRTDRDEYGWRQFWFDRGLQLDEVGFATVRGEVADLGKIDAILNYRVRALGCTVYKVDEIVHGVQVGAQGVSAQVKTWAEQGFLADMVLRLVTEGFNVFITADHGNVEACGIGTPKEGSLCETKGERCRIYSDPRLRTAVQSGFPECVCWEHSGLPRDFHCLLAPTGKAFVQQGQTVVTHGGVSLDEVIVPFVEISRRKAVY